MKIFTRVVMDWDGKILESESFDYDGPLALCGDAGLMGEGGGTAVAEGGGAPARARSRQASAISSYCLGKTPCALPDQSGATISSSRRDLTGGVRSEAVAMAREFLLQFTRNLQSSNTGGSGRSRGSIRSIG